MFWDLATSNLFFIVFFSLILCAYVFQNGRISSLDFHRASSYLVTASDDESIRLYEVTSGT